MDQYGFDDNFDDYGAGYDQQPPKQNAFGSLMGGPSQNQGAAADEFPDFTSKTQQNQNQNQNHWDDEDIWGTSNTQNYGSTAANVQPTYSEQNYAASPSYGMGGDMAAALRGDNKQNAPAQKPFGLDSMSYSHFEKGDDHGQSYQPQGYIGQDVLDQSVNRQSELYRQDSFGNNTQQQQQNYGGYQNEVSPAQQYGGGGYQNDSYGGGYQDNNQRTSAQQRDSYGGGYQDKQDSYGGGYQDNQTQQQSSDNYYGGGQSDPYQNTNTYQQQDNYGGRSSYQENNTYERKSFHEPEHHDYSEPRKSADLRPSNIVAEEPVSIQVENKGIQQQSSSHKQSQDYAQTHETRLREEEERSYQQRQQQSSSVPTGKDGLNIKCSIHEGQFIERICTHPKYPRKRLLCWECCLDESREIQKYRQTLLPIGQYVSQSIQTYVNNEGPAVPKDVQNSMNKLDSTRDSFAQDLRDSVGSLKESLESVKKQILDRFEEMERSIEDIANGKMDSFDKNKDFFHQTLETYYPSSSSQEKPSYDSISKSLPDVHTEKEFDEFMATLKPKVDPATPEVKNFLRVLSHKVDTQELRYPNKETFVSVHSRNLKVMQLQEQIVTNIDGIKSAISELVNSSFIIEDISKTRLVTPQSLTPDSLATLAPLNKVSHDQLRYRLHYENKFSVPEPKRITCIVNIDNEIIAAGSLDKTITFWRISNSELLETIPAHDDAISGLFTYKVCLADLKSRVPQTYNFNEDAVSLLVSTGGKFDNTILFWDISWMHDYINGRISSKQATRVVRRLEGHESGVTAVLPMIDGATLISGAYDGKITVWNTLKGKVVGEIQHHTAAVSSLRLLRCNERYASASWDKTICIWRIFYKDLYDPDTGITSNRRLFEGFEMEKIIDPSFKVMCMNASLVMKNWLVFGGSINRVIVWDVDAGKLVKEFECENNNLAEIVLVEDEQKEKMILMGICDDDDVVRGWDTNYQESEGLLREAYNLKIRSKLYAAKTSVNGSLLQLVQDGRLKLGVVNCAENKDLISLWEVQLGV